MTNRRHPLAQSVLFLFVALTTAALAGDSGAAVRRSAPSVPQAAQAASRAGGALPRVFLSVLPGVRKKSRVPILLPSELPEPIRKAKHVVVSGTSAEGYAISLYYELGIGDAGFAAAFSGESDTDRITPDLPNVQQVKLVRGVRGLFRAVSCGGSCAPANLWWKQGGVLYQVQFELSPSLSEERQRRTMVAAANSAILAGPR